MPSSIIHIALPDSNEQDHHVLFTGLFRTYGARIFFYFKKYLKAEAMAEDLLQELFANIWMKRAGLSQEKNIEAYLFVSARNLLYNHLKRSVALQTVEFSPEIDPAFTYSHVEESLEYKEIRTAYYEVLASLPAQRRKAFELSREKGLSYKEIAQQMGISPRTVEKHVSEALQILKGRMTSTSLVCFLFIFW